MAVGSTNRIIGIPDTFGGKDWAPADHSGPTSYTTGGYLIDPSSFGFNNTIWTLAGGVDSTDTYELVPRFVGPGHSQCYVVWKVMATGLEVAAATNLSAYTVRVAAIGQ